MGRMRVDRRIETGDPAIKIKQSKEGEFNRQAQLVTQPLVWYPLGDVPYVLYVFIKMT